MKKFVIFLFIFLAWAGVSEAATYYVSNSTANGWSVGNDANTTEQAQSTSTPWLTITGAHTKASDGDIIIVNDGDYTEGSFFGFTKGLTVNPQTDYAVTIYTTGTTRVLRVAPTGGQSITFGALVIGGGGNTSYTMDLVNSATKYSLTLNGTKFASSTNYGILSNASKVNLTANNIIIEGSAMAIAGIYSAVVTEGDWVIDGGTMTIAGHTNAAGGCLTDISASASGHTISVSNLTCSITSTGGGYGLRIQNIDNAIINGNHLTLNGDVAFHAIHVSSNNASYTAHTPSIYNNTINHNGTGGIMITHGTDGSSVANNLHNNALIYGNTLNGSDNSTTLHGILLGSNTGGIVKQNKVSKTSLPLLAKLNTNGVFSGNEVRNITGASGHGLRSKGSTGSKFINNTVYLTADYKGHAAIYADEDPTIPTPSIGIVFQNNNIYADVADTIFGAVASTNESNAATFLNNNYYTTAALEADQWTYQGVDYGSLAAWRAAHDPGALGVAPDFAAISTSFALNGTSAAIDVGVAHASYTQDYFGNSIYGAPDIGAYEYQPPYTISGFDLATSSAVRIYGDEKWRSLAATTSPDMADLDVSITGSDTTDWLDIDISIWETDGTYQKTWTASSSVSDVVATFTVGGLVAGNPYTVTLDGTTSDDITGDNCTAGTCTADGSGDITFSYGGSWSIHTFEVLGDVTGPTRSAGSPSTEQSVGTTQVTLSLTTDEAATCRYSTTASTAYASMNDTFTTTGSTAHSTIVTGLANGTIYNYYVRCIDGSSNTNDTDYTISFSVASPAGSSGSIRRVAQVWVPTFTSFPSITSEVRAAMIQELRVLLRSLILEAINLLTKRIEELKAERRVL